MHVGSNGESIVKEVHQLQNAKYTNSMRRDLLGISAFTNDLRKRTTTTSSSGGGDEMNQAMKHNMDEQERIAENMLMLTRNLREQTETANLIIRRDTDVSYANLCTTKCSAHIHGIFCFLLSF